MRRQVFENLGDMAHSVELDHEVQLARSELYKLAKYAIKLHNMMKDADPEQGLEGWVQADISKSAEAISKVYHSLEYEMKVSNNTSDLGSSHGGGEPEGALPFESVNRKKRNTYKESLGRRLQKKTVNEAKVGDVKTIRNKDGSISKSILTKKQFGTGTVWKPFYDEETGPDPMKAVIAQKMLDMADQDPNINLKNSSELKALASKASKEVAKDEGIPKAEMPVINNQTVKDLKAQVVSAQKGGAQQSQANAPAPPPAPQGGAAAPEEPQGGGGLDWAAMAARKDSRTQQSNANTATPVQQQQGGGEAPTGLKTAPLTQGVRTSNSRAAIMYNRKVYKFAGQGKAAPEVGEVISVPWEALGMTPPPGKENVGATVELAHGRMWLTKQAPGPAPQQAPAQQAPAGVDPRLAAAAADPANASKTTANLPGPEAPGTVDHGFQQALNKAGLQPAAQQNVAQAPPAELPAMDQNAQPAPQTVAAQGGNRQDGIKIAPKAGPQPQQQAAFAQGGGGMAAPQQQAAPQQAAPQQAAGNKWGNWDPEFKQGQQATSQQKNYFQRQRTGGRITKPTGKNDASTANYFQKQRTGG